MQIPKKDWLLLSTYLDGELPEKQRQHLERRLQMEADLQRALRRLQQTKKILRSSPQLGLRRDFTLTPEMVGRKVSGKRGFPGYQLAAAVLAVLLIGVLVVDFSGVLGSRSFLEAAAPVGREEALEAVPDAVRESAEEVGEEVFSLEAEPSADQEAEEELQKEAPQAEMAGEKTANGTTPAGESVEGSPPPSTPSPQPTVPEEKPPVPSTMTAPAEEDRSIRPPVDPLLWLEIVLALGVVGFGAAAWIRRRNQQR
jgi:hypothetical protein